MKTSAFDTARIVFLIFLILVTPDCARNPVSHHYEITLMSSAEEVTIGKEQNKAILKLYKKYNDKKLQKYIDTIGQKLVAVAHHRPFKYHFTLIDSGEINAFAMPGGYVYINRGILTQSNSEAEVASVIGHEIGHITARHHARQQVRAMGLSIGSMIATVFLGQAGIYLQRYIDLLFSGIYQSFGRQAELQADELGQEYAAAAGWDPRAETTFLKTLDRLEHGRDRSVFHGFFASHPETYERIEKAETRAGRILASARKPLKTGRKDLLRRLDGISYGNRPELGEFEDSLYRNAKFGISVRFPKDWENFSSEGIVVSRRPDTSEFVQLITAQPKKKHYLDQLTSKEDYFIKLREMAGQFEDKSGWRRNSESRTVINKIPTFVTTYQLQSGLGRFYSVQGHFIIVEKNLFILLAFVPVGQESLADYYFQKVFQSVRRLNEAEREALKPRIIRIHEVRKKETFESIAREYYGSDDKARQIAEFNGYASALYPAPGDLLKIIVRSKEVPKRGSPRNDEKDKKEE
ncbi:MAG: M48 family metalloprotease [Deltaproteobacteria bacterium]|nr:M48 family metalloprotease [Deltaproteobacteria bacterium]